MTIASKYQGYCSSCHYTYFKNEKVRWNGKTTKHVDCLAALTDHLPRSLSKKYVNIYGRIDRKKMYTLLLTMGLHPQGANATGGGDQ